ncbi:ferredoxin [Streptomyces brasiliscabiei]|uniref:Ferredoxin n=1 Tax=Streptomyces brasiliscabiei TaxID=2736302 RepID=A0ABU8GGT0_9ACTN
MTRHFDPLTAIGDAREAFEGRWEDRLWLNVPGPLYGAATDNCWTGRLHAPTHVLYGGDHASEYVFRQPRTPAETARLVEAARQDPFAGYACDGDAWWTPELVREWWRGRAEVTEYLAGRRGEWEEFDARSGQGVVAAVRGFEAYIADGLATDLRVFLYWLEERRSPGVDDRLPVL